MVTVDPHKRLQRRSPAYRAYLELDALPENAPEFDVNEDGIPYVQIAENFCRVALNGGLLCGKKFASRCVLDGHLRRDHATTAQKQPYHSPEMIDSADDFYSELMYERHWPDLSVEGQAPLGLRASQKQKQTISDFAKDDSVVEVATSEVLLRESSERPATKSKQQQDLEYELKKVEIQKKMHVAELRALELQQQLWKLK
ncbi:hypothetical protein Slin14017_G088070 [Septoria linicola]|nr:hypothetical protein Slin14017_G088070 [Septoria linicola]